MLGRDVYVLGVGMSRFGKPGLDVGDRAFEAGIEALEDGAIEFTDIGAVYLGTVLAPPTLGVRVVKDLGLTGVPVQRIENASATGGAAFYEAVHAVASGRAETRARARLRRPRHDALQRVAARRLPADRVGRHTGGVLSRSGPSGGCTTAGRPPRRWPRSPPRTGTWPRATRRPSARPTRR